MPITAASLDYQIVQIEAGLSFYCLVLTVCCAIIGLTFIAAELYYSIRFSYRTPLSLAYAKMGIMFFGTLLVNGMPFFAGKQDHLIVLDVTKWYCILDFGSQISPGPEQTWITLFFAGLACLMVVYSYSTVCWRYRSAFMSSHREDQQDFQVQVYFKYFVMSVCFLICWLPEFTGMVYQAVTGQEKPLVWGALATLGIDLNAMMDPILLVFLDKPIQRNVMNLFGWHSKPQKKKEALKIKSKRDEIRVPQKGFLVLGSVDQERTFKMNSNGRETILE